MIIISLVSLFKGMKLSKYGWFIKPHVMKDLNLDQYVLQYQFAPVTHAFACRIQAILVNCLIAFKAM